MHQGPPAHRLCALKSKILVCRFEILIFIPSTPIIAAHYCSIPQSAFIFGKDCVVLPLNKEKGSKLVQVLTVKLQLKKSTSSSKRRAGKPSILANHKRVYAIIAALKAGLASLRGVCLRPVI